MFLFCVVVVTCVLIVDRQSQEEETKKKTVSDREMSRLSFHVERVQEFDSIWKSRGLGTRMKLALCVLEMPTASSLCCQPKILWYPQRLNPTSSILPLCPGITRSPSSNSSNVHLMDTKEFCRSDAMPVLSIATQGRARSVPHFKSRTRVQRSAPRVT